MRKTLELKLTSNHLIALGVLARAILPVKYIKLVKISVLGEALELQYVGLVRRTEEGPDNDDNSFYQLTDKGRKYLDKITK